MTDYMRVRIMPPSCGARARAVRVPVEYSEDRVFAIHRDVDGRNGWTITHIPSGMQIQQGMTAGDASTLFVDLTRSTLDWRFVDPAGMSKAVRAFGVSARQQYQDQFATVRRRRAG